MTKAVTGTIHKTSFGLFLIPDDQSMVFSVGDSISFNRQFFPSSESSLLRGRMESGH